MFKKLLTSLSVVIAMSSFAISTYAASPEILVNNHTNQSLLLINKERPFYSISTQNITKLSSRDVDYICGIPSSKAPESCNNILRDRISGADIASIVINREHGISTIYWSNDAYIITADPTHLDIKNK